MSARRGHGFTLLETIIAIAILGVALTAIFQISSEAIYAHVYAKKLTVATLLARSKMIDLEQEMFDKGFQLDDDEQAGDFSDDGWASYKWRAKIVAPKTNGLSPDQLIGAIFNLPTGGPPGSEGAGGIGALAGMFGGGKPPAGAPPGGPKTDPASGILGALGPAAGIAQGQFQQLVETLQKSVREVHLTVSWKEGKITESIDIVTHVVSLGPGSDRNGGAGAGVAGAPGSSNPGAFVRADNGMPISNPTPGPNGTMVDPSDNTTVITAEQFQQRATGGGGTPVLPPGLRPNFGVPPTLNGRLNPLGTGKFHN